MLNSAQPRDQPLNDRAALDQIIGQRQIRVLYQPVVELQTRLPIGWEALARGPEGSVLEYPDRLFAAAKDFGLTQALDACCAAAAIEGALRADLGKEVDLFINVEPPERERDPRPAFLSEALARAEESLRITVEITERELTINPAELFELLHRLRDGSDWGIALDDVGVDPRSVGLLPLVEPDVIKLDMSVVQKPMDLIKARMIHAVLADAERTGAKVVAEGIETEEHFDKALALGAHFGQGWLFGRPGPIPSIRRTSHSARRRIQRRMPEDSRRPITPFDHISAIRPVQRASKATLLQMSHAIEDEAVHQGEAGVLVSTFQHQDNYDPRTAARYEKIAEEIAFVGALGEELEIDSNSKVRAAKIDSALDLAGEWDVILLTPHFSAAFASREVVGQKADSSRLFDFAVTYDRSSVAEMTRILMRDIAFSPS